MLPSSSRVKLNRVALKDVIGLKLVPRRRRTPKSPSNVTTGSKRQKETQLVSEPVSVKDIASVLSSSEPVHTLLTDRTGPENVPGNAGTIPEGETEEKCVGVDRNTHPSSTGRTNSEQSLRRVSTCGLCGDCQYISPRRKTLCKQGLKSCSPGPEQPVIEVKLKKKTTVTETSLTETIIWRDQYPKVTLCDVAHKCDALSHDYGYVLPDVLKNKVVHCFKRDMRAGFRLGQGSLGHNKHKTEKGALAKNTEFCPRVQSERSVSQPQGPAEHQHRLKECAAAQTLSSHTTCCFLKSWTSEHSATCSASFLRKKKYKKLTKKGECRTGMWDRDVEEDLGAGSHLKGAEIRTDKRIKLGDIVKDGILPSAPDFERNSCKDSAKTDSRDKEKTCFWMSDDSKACLENAVGGSSAYGSAVTENCVHKKPCGVIDNPTESDAARMSSVRLETDELESSTCQRVRAYCRKIDFSCARTYMSWPFSTSGRTCPAKPIDSSTGGNCDSPINPNQPGSSSIQTATMLPRAATDPSPATTHQVSHRKEERREEDGESILAERNGERHDNMSSYSKDMQFAPQLMEAEESLASLPSDVSTPSNSGWHGRALRTDTVSASSLPVNGPKTDSSTSTPSPTALGLSDWETATTLSPMSSPCGLSRLSTTLSSLPPSSFPLKTVRDVDLSDAQSDSTSATSSSPKCTAKALEKPLLNCEETQMTSRHNSDSFHSCDSSLLLPQGELESDEELLTGRCLPELEPYYIASPIYHHLVAVKESSLYDVLTGKCLETDSNEFMLPPALSPVHSPQRLSRTSVLCHSPGSSADDDDEEVEEINKDPSRRQLLPECRMPQIVNGSTEISQDDLEHGSEDLEGVSPIVTPQSSPSNNEDVDDGGEEGSQSNAFEEDVEQVNNKSEQVPSDPKIKASLTSGVLTEPCSSSSSDEDDGGASSEEGSGPSEIAGSEWAQTKAEAAGDTRQGILDEFAAFEQDILLVDVMQDDPELFVNLPQKSVLKLGPNRATEAPKTRPIGVVKTLPNEASLELMQRVTPVSIHFHDDSPDVTEESNSRPWRPQYSSALPKTQRNIWLATEKQSKNMGQRDANNNRVNGGLERIRLVQAVNSQPNPIPPLTILKNGPWITNPVNMADVRRQKSNAYCRQYFSESLSCGLKMCRFQHVPVEGDEKFCVETVIRFLKTPICLQKAAPVFTGYYSNNPPGIYFSMSMLLSLLWALLKAGKVSEVFSVLSVSLAHKIVPGHEFLLALFNFVREKGLMGFVPELMQLTYKMASAGLVLNLDCLDCVKNTPEFQQAVHHSMSGNHNSAHFPDCLNLAHAIVEIELCTKQEDWRGMGEAFRSVCQSSSRPNQVERISGRIAIALLSECKDRLSLPFAAFAERVCQHEGEDSLVRTSLGRIGVSLMLRYHKTHQWAKGRRVVEVLSISKINYSTLKGLFGNEDGASRCYLVTLGAELFLLNGSVEAALNTLRENKWFLGSCSWPCEAADLESRIRVLIRLAERTSHRDTLEVLSNLPGLEGPNDIVDISRYRLLFNSHLQVCLDRQTLTVAADTVDFMLSKNLPVDHAMLQILVHKLGKQNFWLRAREVFRHSLSVGYYPGVSAPPGFMTLIVPGRLGEVELALTFEMFIAVNATAVLQLSEATASSLRITLRRTQICESEYLSAGSRLLSAACIPQPKLIVHYTAVNSSQEQVFTLEISSARFWLRHNHLWAKEVWMH